MVVDNTELSALDTWVFAEHIKNQSRVSPELKLLVYQVLVLASVIDTGLGCCDPDTWNDDGLDVH